MEFEPLVPVRRRPEVLARLPVGAQLVIGGALLRILEHLVGLADLLETRLGVRLLADVGMVFPRQLAVGPLYLVLGGVAAHPHDFVVIFEFHVISH